MTIILLFLGTLAKKKKVALKLHLTMLSSVGIVWSSWLYDAIFTAKHS
jgi:hypothetical protein